MPPKRGGKRKVAKASGGSATANGAAPLAPPDSTTWPGWAELESEPAFFNVMLREMGVEGVKIQEVYSLDDDMLAFLPQPVHAFIFLFRYKDSDTEAQETGSCPNHVWFANQTPDFACATFALLNIVNNIPGLCLGKELKDFKDFTQDMEPLSRGDAIDSFDFVKRIHNSFARETDLLQADMHLWSKTTKHKKRLIAAKARETREAKKASKAPVKKFLREQVNGSTPTRRSGRATKATPKKDEKAEELLDYPDGGFGNSPKATPSRSTKVEELLDDSDSEFGAVSKVKTDEKGAESEGLRRSKRQPKPRKDSFAASAAATAEEEAEDGFHFIAYMPIKGHVWKLDGLNRHPQDLGPYSQDDGGDWKHVAVPEMMARMAQFEGVIQYNLMAVLHDPTSSEKSALASNIKALKTVDGQLEALAEGWQEMEGAETPLDAFTDSALDFGISAADVESAELPPDVCKKLEGNEDLIKLIEVREEVFRQQRPLRAAVRDAIATSTADDEQARHRRHDYTAFLREWLGALAEQGVLDGLVAES
ncbi:hypothetical protein B0A50_04058 [Salinomyces thailandicus]|uniref:Ubiquitin carboxyl-terminal hydrolase n=1 Tax=Salinomyces thailandicus TaxID=706561 RepID=A0A4U0U0L5_9PEZI|nr:hypothetical protein B0A50_04058 [Salinomyces thailandica]